MKKKISKSDILLASGFVCSLIAFSLTLYYMNCPTFESNLLMQQLFYLGDYLVVLVYGIVWTLILLVYSLVKKHRYQQMYISYSVFCIFMFNVVHDLTILLVNGGVS